MGITGAVGQNQFGEFAGCIVHAARFNRRRLRQTLLHGVRHRRPDRAFAGVLEPRDEAVQKRMRFVAEGGPIRGIEQRMRGFRAFVRHVVSYFRLRL